MKGPRLVTVCMHGDNSDKFLGSQLSDHRGTFSFYFEQKKLPFNIFFGKMMLLITLHPLKHSYVNFCCESNFAPILEFAIFYHFSHIYIEKSYIFSRIPYYLKSRMHVILII